MIALIRAYFRRSWILGVLACIALFAFQMIACRVFLQIQQRGEGLPITRLVPQWVQSAFNINPASITELSGFLSICFQHPFALVVLLATPVALLTGFLTGDVEKRTLSLVLTRPVSRFQVVGAIALVVLFWSALAVASQWAGCIAGAHWTGQTANLNRAGIQQAALSLATLVFAFTGITAAISAMLSIRGDAVGWALTIVLVMYVWNFLAQVWSGGIGMANYSLFHYYQPTDILLHGKIDMRNLQVLSITGAVGWLATAAIFRLRNFSI